MQLMQMREYYAKREEPTANGPKVYLLCGVRELAVMLWNRCSRRAPGVQLTIEWLFQVQLSGGLETGRPLSMESICGPLWITVVWFVKYLLWRKSRLQGRSSKIQENVIALALVRHQVQHACHKAASTDCKRLL